ncbi:polysaccharide deacetylase family protein [Micromonospora sp. WMMD1076]|uniref:polysaccharide deacetylase family protein n=1 Tax=Micromonospora sp. WMMD1076 TaxID=3016103 RepID=UPI002499E02F|nr:polysaccharide deacetylase family protein [Micromonospora sp. WMMD1076]WFF05437.1 polysaccharide deacetylase family protein [Micromonospora sp. WMMD1076]
MRTATLARDAALVVPAAPVVTALPAVRRLLPGLHGIGAPGRVAPTFADGPDPESTGHVLDVLAAHRVRATFFVLGAMPRRHPALGRRVVDDGHEMAVHGSCDRRTACSPPPRSWPPRAPRALIRERAGSLPRARGGGTRIPEPVTRSGRRG